MKRATPAIHLRAVGLVAALVLSLGAGEPARSGAQAVANAGGRVFGIFDTMHYRIHVVTVVDGLSVPYSLAFLPGGSMLVTELYKGQLRLVRDGALAPDPIGGIPAVEANMGEGGLMDVAIHPEFARNNLVYFTYNKPGERGATMALARGTFDGARLTGVTDLLVADAWSTREGQLSSRIAFAPDGTMYMTVSHRGEPARAQNLNDHAGKVLRLRDDGTAPRDNPFVGRAGHRPEIFTYGHRNPHGIAVHPNTGEVWQQEHGGGEQRDERVHILRPGANYGWGLDSVGRENVQQPYMTWPRPWLSLHSLMFYTGNRFPDWQGNLFVGSGSFQGVQRVELGEAGPGFREFLFMKIGRLTRSVRQGPDGLIYFTTDDPGAVMRIEPAE